MNHEVERLSEVQAEISSAVARIVLRLLPRIPRTEWRNRIIPFPAIYKKVGYVMKLDRNTTRTVLKLLSMRNKIEVVDFHGVILQEKTADENLGLQVRRQRVHLPWESPSGSDYCFSYP